MKGYATQADRELRLVASLFVAALSGLAIGKFVFDWYQPTLRMDVPLAAVTAALCVLCAVLLLQTVRLGRAVHAFEHEPLQRTMSPSLLNAEPALEAAPLSENRSLGNCYGWIVRTARSYFLAGVTSSRILVFVNAATCDLPRGLSVSAVRRLRMAEAET